MKTRKAHSSLDAADRVLGTLAKLVLLASRIAKLLYELYLIVGHH
jgi:hypothetical protein